ncbi:MULTISPECIES: lactococcin 972 family bacteriocin [Cellulosimicrobium]|jgi:lactococcin 972 family bacteriocin|uniref:lactococcin 972 family bacteriocin n=1 Tax=Cellulosimicrobium TaxID=157920 RepID=UPI0009DD3753|nr:lactococcin 972 family bacteriocin [Cellulosimicrobium cellulans]MCO7274813.1 lactococcin 972 family bacteriocin [Cellulosimicrobium cellulans]UTT58910.1 lactococcin 972 family bacteriocin [Cellulosimicrobium cellulans]
MRKVMTAVITATLAAGVALGAAGPASATISYPSVGGTWDHGADAKDVWSHYYHGSRVHKSSTYGENGLRSSGWVSAGKWSYQWDEVRWFGNKAYYDVK